MANPLISDRDVSFQLYEVHGALDLCELPYFADHGRETFDPFLAAARKLAREVLFPAYRPMDQEPPRLVDGRVHVHPAMREIWPRLVELGLTCATRPTGVGGQQMPAIVAQMAASYLMAGNAAAMGYLGLTAGAGHLIEEFGDEWLRLGAVKVFADGSLGARTAALFEPYRDDPREGGMLIHPPRELRDLLAGIHRTGFQAAVHAIGDRAIELVIETIEAVSPEPGPRHRIEHAELLHPEHIDRMARHGIVASCQPNFVGQWSLPGGLYETRLGFERNARNNPYREILEKGVALAFGSDGMPYGPLEGIHCAVNAPFGIQRLTVDQGVAAYTTGGAVAGFQESEQGSLAAGRLGDAVVLEGDPWREPGRIREGGVSMTIVAGRVAWKRA